jgi:hypothetical protein
LFSTCFCAFVVKKPNYFHREVTPMQVRLARMAALAVILGLVGALLNARSAAEEANAARSVAASEARLKRDVTFLASDECEGRGPATKGFELAAEYIANEFKKAGLKPGGVDGSYFQPFKVNGARLVQPAHFTLHGPRELTIALPQGVQFNPLGISASGKVKAPVVFAGYGITADIKPEKPPVPKAKPGEEQPKAEAKEAKLTYDDYAGLDVEGKIVLVLRDSPRSANPFGLDRMWKGRNGSLQQKIQNAEKHKAAAIVFINDHGMVDDGDDLMTFNWQCMSPGSGKIPALTIHRSLANSLLRSQGQDLEQIEQDIDHALKPHSLALEGWSGDVDVEVERSREMIPLKNIIGYLDGHGPLANEIVVIGAHCDHVGYGGFASLAGVKKPIIHHGADDNGSGSTAVMELARRFAAMPNREGRKIVFMTFSGEELGLLGSRYFCDHPLFDLKDVAAMVNLDMVGRMSQDEKTKQGKLLTEGTGSAKMWDPLLEQLNAKYGFKLAKNPAVIPYSDHASFYSKKVPVVFFWTGYHPDYHRPTDTADKINVPDMRRIVDLTEDLLSYLATTKERPEYQQIKSQSSQRYTNVPRLGFQPAYGQEGDGVLVEEITEGGPAAKGGIKKGDRIIEIAGKPVKNLEAYMSVMGGQKRGETLELTVLREKKKVTLKVKPE